MSKSSITKPNQLPQWLVISLLLMLLVVLIFLRFYRLESWMQFTWDQVKNAWVMKDMIVDHKLPLLGMPAKLNSGIFIGPAYYYLLYPFFSIFKLNPLAGGVFAGFVSITTFFILFIVVLRLFNSITALVSVGIMASSWYIALTDRIAWPVIFIPMVSVLIYYFSIQIIKRNYKFIIYLAVILGFSFHIHFTAVYFPIIILLYLWMFITDRKSWKYILLAIPFFLIWFIPQFISWRSQSNAITNNMIGYLNTSYHGFHITRFFQLWQDAFIGFEPILFLNILKHTGPILLILFILLIIKNDREFGGKIAFLTSLWFIVPWFIMTLYSGEISNYYFEISQPIILIIIGYLVAQILKIGSKLIVITVTAILVLYICFNVNYFLSHGYNGYEKDKASVRGAIAEGNTVNFTEGDAKSFLYYYLYEYPHIKK
jgi:hypothetical protein